MRQITPENAVSWRDLIDQITPAQIEELEYEERTGCPPFALRWQARHYAQSALGDILMGDIEAPIDATNVYEWETNHYADGRWARSFVGTVRKVGDFSLEVLGEQCEDGTVTREIFCHDDFLTAAEARERAAALIAVADEIDRVPVR